jgi:hypothetical protein
MAGFKVEKVHGYGGVIPMDKITMDTSQTIAEGDMIFVETTGYARIARSTDSALLGLAAEGVTGAAGVRPEINFVPALKNVIFSGKTSGTTTCTVGLIGESVDLEGATGAQKINENASTEKVLRVLGLKDTMPRQAWGDSATLLFTVAKSQYTDY